MASADPGSGDDGTVEGSRFFREEPPEETDPLVDWADRPRAHALVFATLGGFGVFLEQASLLFQIVVGAPVFEELLKFGLALGIVAGLRVGGRPLRFAAALAVGAAFGYLEHVVTYPAEPLEALRFRLTFHGGTTALSMAVYDAVHPVKDPRIRWAATVPATLLHWANNAAAVAMGVVGVAAGEVRGETALLVGQVSAGLVVGLAVAALLNPHQARRWTLHLWARFAPKRLRDPEPGTPDPGPPPP